MRKLTFALFVTLIFLSSCQLQKIVVQVYTPSDLVFPPEVKSVLITSRFVPATGPYEDIQWGAYESVDSLKWSMSESLVDTLAKRMAAGSRYMVKAKHFPRMLRHNDATLPDPLPWEGVNAIAKKELVQSLLIIEGFGIRKTPVVVSENSGNFVARFSIGITMAIRIYEPDKSRMIDDSVYVFSSEFKGIGKTAKEAGEKLPDEREATIDACSHAAEAYCEMITPGNVPEVRHYYNEGDSSLVKASQAVIEGKWGRAESKWKWLAYNNKDSLIQAKASYNMALACERDGRLYQAMGFARRSQRIKPNNHTLRYISVLEKRILEYDNQIKEKKIIRKW